MDSVRVKRSQFATFLNTTPNGDTATYARMGKGITSASVAYNPTVNDELYISEDGANKSLDSYAPSMASEQIAFAGDPVFDYPYLRRRAGGVLRTRASGRSALYGQANDGHYRLARRHRAGDAGSGRRAAGKTAPGAKVVRSHGDLYPPWHGVDHPVAAGSDPAFRGAGAVLSGAQKARRRGEKSACRRLRPDDE